MARLLLVAVLVACGGDEISGTTCSTDAHCNLFNVKGTCEPNGLCSYPDETCSEGRRYSPGAGALANTCLGTPVSTECGGKDQPCCGTTCGPDLACAVESGTCQCGGSGEPCCGGASCDGSLSCSAGRCATAAGVTDVGIGQSTICALRTTGVVDCWGLDVTWSDHIAGHAVPTINTLIPTAVANLSGVAELRAGDLHMCARKTDGSIWCWGHNENNQLGNGTAASSAAAVQVTGLSEVSTFDVGRMHACAVGKYIGTAGVWCWGRNGQKGFRSISMLNPNLGRLGNGTNTETSVPVAVDLSAATAGGQTVKNLSAGAFHSCVVMSDNTVWCWGRNATGALGNGATVDTSAPVMVNLAGLSPAIPNGVTIDEVMCTSNRKGQDSTCLRLSNGSIHCWGFGANGELGDGTTATRTAPTTQVDIGVLGAPAVALAAAARAFCARSSAGTVACWGKNHKGLLGNGLANSGAFSRPTLATVNGVTRLAMGHQTACAVDTQQRLLCWGNNQRGQISRVPPTGSADAQVLLPVQVLP